MGDTKHGTGPVDLNLDAPPSPGDYLEAVLKAQSVSQSELAARAGLSAKLVNQVVNGKASLTAETADALEFATGVNARIWLTLEAEYRAAERSDKREELLNTEVAREWFRSFDARELIKHHLVPRGPESSQIEALLRFFGVAKPEAWASHWGASLPRFRRSPSFAPEQAATAVWLRIGQLKAQAALTSGFNEKGLRSAVGDLRAITREPDLTAALRTVQTVCSEFGVAVVYAAEVSGCRASGAAWWVKKDKAVVLLSDRGKREDRLWFSLFHELGHVLLHARRDTFIDQISDDEEGPPWHPGHDIDHLIIDDRARDTLFEQEADDFAQRALIPQDWVEKVRRAKSKQQVRDIARLLGASDGVVAGRWQYEHNNYKQFNELRRPLPRDLFLEPPPRMSGS
jgi:HTH-type transcriptional regulator/antitoxin HigA